MTHIARPTVTDAIDATGRFATGGPVVAITPLAGGHIHASFRVDCESVAPPKSCLIQCLNEHVFKRPEYVTDNIRRVTTHIRAKLAAAGVHDGERRVLTPVRARDGSLLWRDTLGRAWRMYHYIEGAVSYTRVTAPHQAAQAGRAYGEFQLLLADLPEPPLHVTIPDFHNTSKRLAALEDAARADRAGRLVNCAAELASVRDRVGLAERFSCQQAGAELPRRVVHNDAKLSNILFDADSGAPLCVVDLDTVMPGLALDDFGDMVRSMTATCDEEETDTVRVAVDPALLEALARGYLAATGSMLAREERGLLVSAGQVITFEQAVRFLTDYLAGDVYYRTTRPEQNLHRTRNQLALLTSLERHAPAFARLIDAM